MVSKYFSCQLIILIIIIITFNISFTKSFTISVDDSKRESSKNYNEVLSLIKNENENKTPPNNYQFPNSNKFGLNILPNYEIIENETITKEKNGSVVGSTNEAVNFMKKFGYVPAGDGDAGFIFSAETFKEKLREVQKFGAIPQTGELDEATIKLMNTPRCGVHDIDSEEGQRRRKRFILGSKGWNKRSLTYMVANWSPTLISKETVQEELRKAFEHWSRYSNLKFTEVDTNDADIVIFFATYNHYDSYPFDGQGGILAHAYYPYEFGSYGGDIHFDESEDWKIRPEDDHSGLDFFTVAVHEIGHSLGLAHSGVPTSIMFPYYKGVERNFALDYDDIMGMWDLYIRRRLDGDDEYFRTSTTTTTTSTTTTTTTTTPSYDETQNDEGDEGVIYHGDSETVDEHEKKKKEREEEGNLPSLPPLFPGKGEDDYNARERKWREEAERRRKEEEERRRKLDEEERKRWEEDRKREEEETRKRRREEERERREEERRRREWEKERSTEVPPKDDDVIPDICKGNFDSIALLRDELFVFKGKYMWRFERQGSIIAGYPALIRNLFAGLPSSLNKIDAAYERKNDSSIVFFIGKEYYVHDGIKVIEGTPKPISYYGIPEEISSIDAVFFWPKNRKTYLFSRNLYWRRDDFTDSMEENYPRSMEKWNGLPRDLDGAVTDAYGTSYFFKNEQVWQYNNDYVRPTHNSPSNDLRRWTGC